MIKFPSDFIFGAAIAAYQVEGGVKGRSKGRVMWDRQLELENKVSADVAVDFFNKYEIDLENCKKFGIKALRISISWSRLFPTGFGEPNENGVDFYHRVFKQCREKGIEPYVTLHHFDTPERIFADGDWMNDDNIDHFINFAEFCFVEYKNEVKKWITINEPTTLAKQQNISGTFPPGIKFDFNRCFKQQHRMNLAHAKIVKIFKENNFEGEIGIVHAIQTIYPNSDEEEDRQAAWRQNVLENKFLLEGTLKGEYSGTTLNTVNTIIKNNKQEPIKISKADQDILSYAANNLDFVGINYYYSKFIKHFEGESEFNHNAKGEKGTSIAQLHGVGKECKRDDLPHTDWDWSIYPKGLKDTLKKLHHDYPKINNIYITENGIGLNEKLDKKTGIIEDDKRISYLKLHLNATLEAIEEGVPVKGFFVWSLMDLFSWTNGYKKRYGLFYVDFDSLERFPKRSAFWYKDVIESKKIIK